MKTLLKILKQVTSENYTISREDTDTTFKIKDKYGIYIVVRKVYNRYTIQSTTLFCENINFSGTLKEAKDILFALKGKL